MTGLELYTQHTEVYGGSAMNTTLFYQYLNIFRIVIEGMRPWMWLRKIDSSQTITSSNTIDTQKSLPSDFRRPYNQRISEYDKRKVSMFLKSSDGEVIPLELRPFGQQEMYRNVNGYWFYDIRQQKFYISGTYNKTYTVYLSYIHNPGDVNATTEWIFPDEYHPILSHMVAEASKGGIDYDEINARQAVYNSKVGNQILNAMIMWDDELQRSQYGV